MMFGHNILKELLDKLKDIDHPLSKVIRKCEDCQNDINIIKDKHCKQDSLINKFIPEERKKVICESCNRQRKLKKILK